MGASLMVCRSDLEAFGRDVVKWQLPSPSLLDSKCEHIADHEAVANRRVCFVIFCKELLEAWQKHVLLSHAASSIVSCSLVAAPPATRFKDDGRESTAAVPLGEERHEAPRARAQQPTGLAHLSFARLFVQASVWVFAWYRLSSARMVANVCTKQHFQLPLLVILCPETVPWTIDIDDAKVSCSTCGMGSLPRVDVWEGREVENPSKGFFWEWFIVTRAVLCGFDMGWSVEMVDQVALFCGVDGRWGPCPWNNFGTEIFC